MSKKTTDQKFKPTVIKKESIAKPGMPDVLVSRAEKINKVLFEISNSVNTTRNLDDMYRQIRSCMGSIIDVTNFFIAMVDSGRKTLDFAYHVDERDDDFSPITEFDTKDSLTGLVVLCRKPLLLTQEDLEIRASQNGVWGPVPLIWMGVPLMIKDQVIGIVAVQSYTDPDAYDANDLQVLTAVSSQIAIAIDRQQSYENLKKSEHRYRQLFNLSNDAIIIHQSGRIIDANKTAIDILGYRIDQFQAMNISDLLSGAHQKKAETELNQILSGQAVCFETEWRKSDNTLVPIEVSSKRVDEENDIVQSIGRDISQRKRDQNEKVQALQFAAEQQKYALVGQVAGKMAHDFNNILGIIMGNAELALMNCSDESYKKVLTLIFQQSLRGKNLTGNLIAFARDQEPKQTYFNINEKLDLVLDLMEKDLEGIRLTRKYQETIPDLLADSGMIEHAIVNIIQNAIHAMGKVQDPDLTLETFSRDGHISVVIKDNGCGIPKAHLKNIFIPSFTLKGSKDVSGSYKTGIKGTGYGMSNVKKYIEQHRGKITLTSAENKGTSVTISLPLIEKELTPQEKYQIEQDPVCQGKSVLIVEDEADISRVQFRILSQAPFFHYVDIADNGTKAMEMFTAGEYDLVSLDYILPGNVNGMDVYHFIRKHNKIVPVLFVSGNLEFLESIRALKEVDPNIDHISKPCRNSEYARQVNHFFCVI